MTREEVDRAVEMLKEMCDPRGHDLLDAMGAALLEASDATTSLHHMFSRLVPFDVSKVVGFDELGVSADGEFARKVPLT